MTLQIIPLVGLPEIAEGTDLAAAIASAATACGGLQHGDVLVVSSKVISKSAGLLDRSTDREQVVAQHSLRVVAERRAADGHLTRVVEARSGPVMMAAGVDASNIGAAQGFLTLPLDPDGDAHTLREQLVASLPGSGAGIGVIISDTAGRPWRHGVTDFALGCAGIGPTLDHRGAVDDDGRPLTVTVRAIADELAAAADLVKGKIDRIPAAVVRGVPQSWLEAGAPGGRALVRTGAADWFATGHVEAVRAALGVEPGSPASVEVGIQGIGDGLAQRVARVIALALYDQDEVGIDVDGATCTISSEDAVALGRVLARLEVAAYSDGLRTVADPANRATLTLVERQGTSPRSHR